MRNPFNLIVELVKQPAWLLVWLSIVVVVNMFGLVFIDHIIAEWIVGIFLFQSVIMMLLYSYYGYEKILGLSHIFWIPLLGYILLNISSYDGNILYYLSVLLLINAISLVIDSIDVFTYFKQKNA